MIAVNYLYLTLAKRPTTFFFTIADISLYLALKNNCGRDSRFIFAFLAQKCGRWPRCAGGCHIEVKYIVKCIGGNLRVAAKDRWPLNGGGRQGRFDCIYIYIYILNSVF